MKVHHENLTDVDRYIETHEHLDLEDNRRDFEIVLGRIRRFKPVDANTRMLEIGIGTGWFPILCKKEGIACTGIEISPQLVDFARAFGKRCGIEPDIVLGNIEEEDLGTSRWDVIIASSTFEHVEHWRETAAKVYAALAPGGLFYFLSTNKFSPTSHEYKIPFYGWLPNGWRYRLRAARQGADIMKLGIDFNQFTYIGLRRFFKRLGFAAVYDRLQIFCLSNATRPGAAKKAVYGLINRVRPLREAALFFASSTLFICIKGNEPASAATKAPGAEPR